MSVFVGETELKRISSFATPIQNLGHKNNLPAYQHCVKADALRIKNYFFESIEEYLRAIKFDDRNAEAYKGMGLSYKQIGYYKSAIEAFNSARKLTPFDKELYFEIGYCSLKENDACDAIKNLQKFIKYDETNTDAQFYLAVAHEMLNESEMAIDIYNKIIDMEPGYIAAHNNLGGLYMRMGQYNDALNVFKEFQYIDKGNSRALLGMAVAYDKLEQNNNAVRLYKKYMTVDIDSPRSEYITTRINELRTERVKENRFLQHLRLICCG